MELYDRDYLTFVIKDEPNSDDELIGFEETSPVYVKRSKKIDIVELPMNDELPKQKHIEIQIEPIDVKYKDTSLIGGNRRQENDDGIKHMSMYLCDICGANYTRKSKLRTHILNHVVKEPNELPLCEFCGEVFDSIDNFFKHFEETHGTNAEDVLITFNIVKHVLCCEYCGNAYAHPDSLNKHRNIHDGDLKPYSCRYCIQNFDAYSKLVTHSLKHNDIKVDYPVDRYWMCDYDGCSKALKNITSLNYHKKNVHEKKYMSQCKLCSEIFENSWSLHNHMQVKHLGPFPCPICERSCPTTKLLKRHMMTHNKLEGDQASQTRRIVNYCKYLQVDSKNGTYSCKVCYQTFDTRKKFRMHVVETHDKSKNFFCDQCDRGFTLAWQLNSHVESAHSKKFQCTVCGVYKNKHSKLLQHMKIHLYPCHCCDKSFSRQQYLDNHIKKRHISKLICGNFEQKVLNKCEYVDSNGVRRPQPTKIYVMPGPSTDGSIDSQTPIRTINVNIGQTSNKYSKKETTTSNGLQPCEQTKDVNDQQNLENLAAIAFLESEMKQAAKLLTMPFVNK